jgi:transketolase
VEDLSWLRALPGLDIIVPADRAETRQALRRSARDPRPTFIRIGRTPVPDVTCPDDRLRRGRFTQLRDGSDATIIAVGVAVARALRAAAELADEGVGVRVLNAAYVAPLDTQAIIGAASQTHAIVVAEEANLAGGLGAAVASVVSQLGRAARVPMRLLGLAEFAPTGSSEFLLDYFGLTAAKMRSAVLEALLG